MWCICSLIMFGAVSVDRKFAAGVENKLPNITQIYLNEDSQFGTKILLVLLGPISLGGCTGVHLTLSEYTAMVTSGSIKLPDK